MALYPYKKSAQFKTYIGQFMRVFSGFQTQDNVSRNGSNNLRRIPVVYGNMSRIVASRLNPDTDYRGTLPMFAVNLSGITPNQEENRSHTHIDSVLEPTKGVTAYRLIGPAFIMNMELSIYASSQTELFETLEQILLIFNPRVAMRVSSDAHNSDYITEISLTGIQPEFNYPLGTDSQVCMLTLSFDVPIRLRYPYGITEGIIEEIIVNIKDGNSEDTYFEDSITEADL